MLPPPTDLQELENWVKDYLKPINGQSAKRAHLFTINGFTYPFVRDMRFCCVPDPPGTSIQMSKRRYSLLAYLFGTRPGDLLFFFQADPQWPSDDIENRRGFRGIYRVLGTPFRDIDQITHPETNYEIHGSCPNCGKPFATLGKYCRICNNPYPEVDVTAVYRNRPSNRTKSFRIHVLSLRFMIEPLVVFGRTLGDNRAYMDMQDPGLIWISRSDNSMGAGKGSSIRHILSEDAVKITRMLKTEPDQLVINPQHIPYNPVNPQTIQNDDGIESIYPKFKNRGTVSHEMHLNLHISRTIDDASSSIQQALSNDIISGHLEYWGSEFPWGYTGDTADFVCTLHDGQRRYRILILEFKIGDLDDRALVQLMLYIQWVTQVCTQFSDPPISEIEVVPVLIGNRNRLSRLPQPYQYNAQYLVGNVKTINVKTPRIIQYQPIGIFRNGGSLYAKDLRYVNVSSGIPAVPWIPPQGISTRRVEQDWVVEQWRSSFTR